MFSLLHPFDFENFPGFLLLSWRSEFMETLILAILEILPQKIRFCVFCFFNKDIQFIEKAIFSPAQFPLCLCKKIS